MATPRELMEQQHGNTAQTGPGLKPSEEPLGEQLMREAQESHADFLAGWTKFTEEVGIRGKPMGAKKLRALLLQTGINPDKNEFSRGIIAMREE